MIIDIALGVALAPFMLGFILAGLTAAAWLVAWIWIIVSLPFSIMADQMEPQAFRVLCGITLGFFALMLWFSLIEPYLV